MQIETQDGHQIVTILEECGASEIVLLCHGITSEKNEGGVYSSFAKKLRDADLDSLRFDFRGHGESPISGPSSTISGMVMDFAACLDACGKRYSKVHIVSASFGSSIFLLALQNLDLEAANVRSAALWNPVTDYASTFFRATVEWGPSFFPQGDLLNALSKSPVSFGENSLQIEAQFVAELMCFRPDLVSIPRSIPTRI